MTPARLLAAIGAALLSLTLFNLGATSLTRNVLLDMPALEAGAEYARIGQEALRKYPKLSPLEARAKYSNEILEERLAEAEGAPARAVVAASAFLGFWLVQGRARAEFCNAAGVDFARFQADFEQENEALHEIATAVLEKANAPEERLWKSARGVMQQQIQYEMLYIKGGLPTERKDACEFLLARRAELRQFFHYRHASPAGYRALLDARAEA